MKWALQGVLDGLFQTSVVLFFLIPISIPLFSFISVGTSYAYALPFSMLAVCQFSACIWSIAYFVLVLLGNPRQTERAVPALGIILITKLFVAFVTGMEHPGYLQFYVHALTAVAVLALVITFLLPVRQKLENDQI